MPIFTLSHWYDKLSAENLNQYRLAVRNGCHFQHRRKYHDVHLILISRNLGFRPVLLGKGFGLTMDAAFENAMKDSEGRR